MILLTLIFTVLLGLVSFADKSVPDLYRNDTKYTITEYPPEIVSGEIYVPLSFFVGLSDIQYVYSSENPGFYLRNENTGRFVSFAFNTDGIVVDSEFVSIVFPILNNTVYLPLEYCSEILSLKIEKVQNNKVRLSDGTQKLTFSELINIYEESEKPDDPSVILPDDPNKPSDNPAKVRQLYISVDSRVGEYTENILDSFKKYGKKGTFLFDANSVKRIPETVLRAFVEGHAVAIAYIGEDDLKETQKALYSILNTHARMIAVLDAELSFQELVNLKERGYLTIEANLLEDGEKSATDTAKEIYNSTFKKNTTSYVLKANKEHSEIINKILNYTSDDNGIDVLAIETTSQHILGGN